MATNENIIVGFLIILLISTGAYITLIDQDLRIRVDEDKTTFYVKNENNRWTVSGREFNKLFDGTSRMNRRSSETNVTTIINNISNTVTIIRHTKFIRGPVIKNTYTFDGRINDVELFPIRHTVEIINGTGFFYRYEVRDLIFDGIAGRVDVTEMEFGRNMKVTWQGGYRWARTYKSGILKVQYDIPSDYEVFNVRLFDPEPILMPDFLIEDILISPGVFEIRTCELEYYQEDVFAEITKERDVYGDCYIDNFVNITSCLNFTGLNTDCSTTEINQGYNISCVVGLENYRVTEKIGEITKSNKINCISLGLKKGNLELTCPLDHRCDVIGDEYYILDCNDGDCNFDATENQGRGWSSISISISELSEGEFKVADYKKPVLKVIRK